MFLSSLGIDFKDFQRTVFKKRQRHYRKNAKACQEETATGRHAGRRLPKFLFPGMRNFLETPKIRCMIPASCGHAGPHASTKNGGDHEFRAVSRRRL